jgi:hypothetical protein
MSAQQCILVTGLGHSATRLLVQLLSRHPDVSVPLEQLDPVQEFRPLHMWFVQAMDRTPLYAPDYWIDEDELGVILDAYELNVDPAKPYFVIKQPYYPLYYLESFARRYPERLHLVYTERPIEKVIRSWQRDQGDYFFFEGPELLRQAKKLHPDDRARYLTDLATYDSTEYLKAVERHSVALRDAWNERHPDQPFTTIDMERLSREPAYLREVLESMGLSTDPVEQMLEIVDHERLIRGKQRRGKSVLRAITPPALWQLGRRLLGRSST